MIKTILWDFDGVILDSMKIKGDGFLELFKEFAKEDIEKLYKFHFDNGGVSRFEKIRYFYTDILQKEITEEEVLKLAEEFGDIISKKLFDKNNLIEDSLSFIKANYTKCDFHIVSGAEHNELNKICRYFELSKYFITINGSPVKKDILIKNILDNYSYKDEETILIGDAMTDYNAALKNGIKFYGYNNLELKKFDYIDTLSEFNI